MASSIPRVLAVSGALPPERPAARAAWRVWCAGLAGAGVDALQVRLGELDDAEILELTRRARAESPRELLVLVNGRLDLALAASADGVHLPADGPPTAAVRAAAGPRLLVGRSTHSESEVAALAAEGAADYAIFGPVFDTPGKRGRLEPRGLERLSAACAAGLPVIAIGGIDAANAGAALAAGAAGVAAIRACADEASARELVASARGAEGAA